MLTIQHDEFSHVLSLSRLISVTSRMTPNTKAKSTGCVWSATTEVHCHQLLTFSNCLSLASLLQYPEQSWFHSYAITLALIQLPTCFSCPRRVKLDH